MKCSTKHCRGVATQSGKTLHCSKCRTRRFKERHPIKYAYIKLRNRAKERGHAFTLTLEKFTELWSNGLFALRGKEGHSLSIHRIKNELGYHDDNVEVRTLSENSRLQHVPYFKNKADEEAAVAEPSAAIKEAYSLP